MNIKDIAAKKSSDDLMGDIMGGYLDPVELCTDRLLGLKVQEAIDLLNEYADSLEAIVEIC